MWSPEGATDGGFERNHRKRFPWGFIFFGSDGPVGAKQLPTVDAGRVPVVPGDADPPRADELRVDDPQRLRRGAQRPDGQIAIAPRAALRARAVLAQLPRDQMKVSNRALPVTSKPDLS